MRVGIVSTWDTQCGIATYTRALREHLLALGVEADVVAVDRTEVKYLARRELRPYFRDVADRLDDFDVVHVQHEHGIFGGSHALPVSVGITRDFLDRLARRRRDRPVVVTLHTEPLDSFGPPTSGYALAMGAAQRLHWSLAMARTFRRHASLRAIVHTRGTRRAFIDSGMPPESIAVVPHGMHLPAGGPPSDAERAEARERLGLPPQAVVLAQFGFLAAYKGITTSVEALRHLDDRFRLAVLGDVHPHGGDETLERVLEALDDDAAPARRPIAGRVHIQGWVEPEELRDWRAAASMVLAPYEPVNGFSFSGALTWAFGAGVPILASRIPPFVEVQEEAGCFALVAPGAPRELAHRVRQLDARPEVARTLAEAARSHGERCSWPRVAERHAELYAAALSGADQPAASRTWSLTSLRSARSASAINGSSSSHDGAPRSRSASSFR